MFSSKKKSSSLEMTDEAHYWLICAYTFLTAEMYRRLCFLSLKMKGSDSAHLQTRKRFLPFASAAGRVKDFLKKPMYIPWFHHDRATPTAFHSSCHPIHGEETSLCVSIGAASSWNKYKGLTSSSSYAPNTSSAWTSMQMIYLHSIQSAFCESSPLYHRYNQAPVYKIC